MKEDSLIRKKFCFRHIGASFNEINDMLKTLQCSSIKDFINKTVPKEIRLKKRLDLPHSISEYQYLKHIYRISKKNKIYRSYIGLGYKNTITPSVIQRNILENPSWYTPYTPYQSEISQGRLEALINFQTMISDLTGMKISNASMLDESTAASDAMFMIFQEKIKKKQIDNNYYFFISNEIFPQTFAVLKTRCFGLGIHVINDTHKNLKKYNKKKYSDIISYPSSLGKIYDYAETVEYAKRKKISIIVSADLLSLSLLKPPGEWGADVVIGSSQSFGIPMGYGGPHAAFFSTHEQYKRFLPGRIIGVSVDQNNKKAFRMALQTREQHIKREKATSNICTSQVLPAVMASMYALYHGKEGLTEIAKRIHEYAKKLEFLLINNINHIFQVNDFYFDTLRIKTDHVIKIRKVAERKKTNFRYINQNYLTITLDETTCQEDINHILSIFYEAYNKNKKTYVKKCHQNIHDEYKFPNSLKRTSNFLKHKIFKKFYSENELMRYIKRLEKKDISLTHSMIPLGSCTMKLNASSELFSLSQHEWRDVHPFVPDKQAMGYHIVIQNLKKYLKEITGFSEISLQPNSGAQGEYAGLMTIKCYHHSLQEFRRNVTLIPSSSHGTNPASAYMAGMKVILIDTKNDGSINQNDLLKKVKENKDSLSTLMITYPSTYGIYEKNIQEIIKIIHDSGGQVYMDGANMNAQVGLIKPAYLGVDICHLNLHKTFAIPHGGGGPGMGPICVASHLKPFLPKHPFQKKQQEENKRKEDKILTISSSPYGSSLILTISYAYIRLLGPDGLRMCTEISILNANYIKEKLREFYNILYVGENNTVAHELIIDCRIFKSMNIGVIDIAKRMMDYGYHAPTISFPVEGCMMIEPTESESKEELDRFIETLISIRQEIKEIENGKFSKKNNVLKNAPHNIDVLTQNEWNYPYSREKAAYPLSWIKERKFWPSVTRVDDAYGDRNLICTCI
ncbi:Glycine dehydrogenase (decarboxylating) [Blattabacterium sp. (Nauphoeta cinerea)]|uniref:aminomethyl-transferring glycine dehydrogenase n=1 Tax=Blattabacterium sp. (Nauphoeta cinerea) TaxID=1316444 RepID=UPI0003B106C6|nr:aminomethyl-transferring glycine dehydrogenase [Blattabacterium sp. (Nauphoeta cinerea)]AGW86357.1 Glycine dehydrogenase (decarboxylating) [Blattabacterium sp. (Nauphoeta cinerea)]